MAAAEARAMPDLRRRTIVGVAAGAVALLALWVGGVALWVLATAMALIGFVEWVPLVRADRWRLAIGFVLLATALLYALPFLWGTDRSTVALLLIGAMLFALVPGSGGAALGVAYLGLAGIGLVYLRGLPQGLLLALWTLAVVWATDIGAYFAGRAIGGPKLAPAISPAKTWAGLGGGVVAAWIVGSAIGAAGHLPSATLVLPPLLAVVAQLGDLIESALKRRVGAKDSGRLLPGHGGVLDRVDGALPVIILIAALNANGSF